MVQLLRMALVLLQRMLMLVWSVLVWGLALWTMLEVKRLLKKTTLISIVSMYNILQRCQKAAPGGMARLCRPTHEKHSLVARVFCRPQGLGSTIDQQKQVAELVGNHLLRALTVYPARVHHARQGAKRRATGLAQMGSQSASPVSVLSIPSLRTICVRESVRDVRADLCTPWAGWSFDKWASVAADLL